MSKKIWSILLAICICIVTILSFAAVEENVYAAESETVADNAGTVTGSTHKAAKLTIKKPDKWIRNQLKGTWETGHQTQDKYGNYVAWSYVKFTKKYAKYYRKEKSKLIYVEKYRIVSIDKLKSKKGKLKGFLIKLKKGNHKQSYRLLLKDTEILHYFDGWSTKYYSGSSSLTKGS